jgi:hypothetical protein
MQTLFLVTSKQGMELPRRHRIKCIVGELQIIPRD